MGPKTEKDFLPDLRKSGVRVLLQLETADTVHSSSDNKLPVPPFLPTVPPGAGIMEADDRQVTTVFTVQPSFHHWHSSNRVHVS